MRQFELGQDREKKQYNQKSHTGVIFPLFGGKPPLGRFDAKVAWWGIRDVITCAEFQIEIFMGYNFTGGRIFDFCIDFSMGLTTLQRAANALPVIIHWLKEKCLRIWWLVELESSVYNNFWHIYYQDIGRFPPHLFYTPTLPWETANT